MPVQGRDEVKTINQWLSLYSLVSSRKLSPPEELEIRKSVRKLLIGNERESFAAINYFWPLIENEMRMNPEQKANFKDLFRALLRLESHSASVSRTESDTLSSVLGLERIAVAGNPNLTEEAVDAYADMACFLYEQKHTGKTIDAMDNRVIFASVIAKKFEEAPNDADKQSMANFALKWSKFKILYAKADEAQKADLIKRIRGSSPKELEVTVKCPALDAVLSHGPWMHELTK